MRVLFIESNPMWIHGLPNGFRDLGHEVIVSGVLTGANIPELIATFKPHIIVMMGWTPEHLPANLKFIYEHAKPVGIPIVYWATEDPTHTSSFTMMVIGTLHPDFIFTSCPEMVDYYKRLNLKSAHLNFGYHPSDHYRTDICERYRCGIAVVAGAYPHVLAAHPNLFRMTSLNNLIKPLIDEHIRVDFWGDNWNRMEHLLGNIPPEWIHGYVPHTETNKVYCSADIVIGLQNYYNMITKRTYEILGSEGFLLTSDTPEIRRYFEPGKDLIVSASPEETVSLVRYYASHPEEREIIRKQGAATVASHSYQFRAQQMIDTLKEYGIPHDETG